MPCRVVRTPLETIFILTALIAKFMDTRLPKARHAELAQDVLTVFNRMATTSVFRDRADTHRRYTLDIHTLIVLEFMRSGGERVMGIEFIPTHHDVPEHMLEISATLELINRSQRQFTDARAVTSACMVEWCKTNTPTISITADATRSILSAHRHVVPSRPQAAVARSTTLCVRNNR